jgi:hypothetical protein
VRLDATSASPKGDADERAVLQRTIKADRCYVLDRGNISYRLWNAINAAGSSYVSWRQTGPQPRTRILRQDRWHADPDLQGREAE